MILSAIGPAFFAFIKDNTGSFNYAFYGMNIYNLFLMIMSSIFIYKPKN